LLHNCTEPFLCVAAVRAEINRLQREAERKQKLAAVPTMTQIDLRNELRALGIKNSFKGCKQTLLRSILTTALSREGDDPSDTKNVVPQQLNREKPLRQLREKEYLALLEGVTLRQLAQCLPTDHWEHYCANGWLKVGLELSKKERRMIALCHRVALCELGVDPTNRATFVNATNVLGYDANWGWLRSPSNSSAQLYLATHPRLYRLHVGLYARLLLRCMRSGRYPPGVTSEAEAIRCCLELRLQLYNTKIALPQAGKPRTFSHLDCDWQRGGCTTTPAPQCFVATSPQQVGSKRVFSATFVDAEDAVKDYESEAPSKRARGYARGGPYQLPRTQKGGGIGLATKVPKSVDFERDGTGPEDMQIGDMILFGHLVAHEFTQHPTLSSPPPSLTAVANADAATGLAAESSASCMPASSAVPPDRLPIGLTRTAEYPSLMAPWIHGEAHQAVDEVLRALLTGTAPRCWSHVYTGNAMHNSAALFSPILPPLAAVPSTLLARVLVGVDAFAQHPSAVEWLVRDCRDATVDGESAKRMGEHEALTLHKRLMLDEMMSGLRQRLKRLASGKMASLLEIAESATGAATSRRSPFATSATFALPAAAQMAMADPTLRASASRDARSMDDVRLDSVHAPQ